MKSKIESLQSALNAVVTQYNRDSVEYHEMYDQIETQAETIATLNEALKESYDVMSQQGLMIDTHRLELNKANQIIAQLKAKNTQLISLDAPGAVKRSKAYKKKNDELKATNKLLDDKRKAALSELNKLKRDRQ